MTVTTITETDDAAIVVTTDDISVPAPVNKLVSFSRLMTLGAGSQSVTGIGFTPRLIIFRSNIGGTAFFSIGSATLLAQNCTTYSSGVWAPQIYAGLAAADGTNFQTFIVASFDPDGFTVTWTKTLSPTGTATIYAECFR